MIELYEALFNLFNSVMTVYSKNAPKGATLPYAVMDIPSGTVFADYRDDITVTINIFDDKKNKLRDIETFYKEFRKLHKTGQRTANGSFWLLVSNFLGNELDFEIQQNRRREITFDARWYDEDLLEDC